MSAIIACLWQGLALAWLTALLLRLTSRLNAATRHAIWWLALASVLTLPFAHFAASTTVELSGPALAATIDADTPALLLPAPPDWLIACLAGAWLGVVLLAFARLVCAVGLIAAVKRRSHRVDEAIQRSLPLWTAIRGTGRAPELRVSNELSGACALGLSGRPVILVSTRLVAALDSDELDQIVMHEFAHLARYDDWLRMIQSLVTGLFGLHPAVHFISARIDLEREAACDDRVVAQTGAAERYASCLANAADLSRARQPLSLEPMLAPHASHPHGALLKRVRRLLDPRTSRDAHLKWAITAASIVAFSIAVLFSPAAQPLVVVLGAMTGVPQMHEPPAVGRMEWPTALLAPLGPSPGDVVLPYVSSAAARSEIVAAAPEFNPAPPTRLASFDGQLSWTMPRGIDDVVALSAEPGRALSATPLQPWSMTGPGHRPSAQPPGRDAETAHDSAWKAAGYTGAAVGIGVARAGIATGAGSRKAGTAVASFFSRAGKAVAGGF